MGLATNFGRLQKEKLNAHQNSQTLYKPSIPKLGSLLLLFLLKFKSKMADNNCLANLETLSSVASSILNNSDRNCFISDNDSLEESGFEDHVNSSSTNCSLLSSPMTRTKDEFSIIDHKPIASKESLEIANSLLQLKTNNKMNTEIFCRQNQIPKKNFRSKNTNLLKNKRVFSQERGTLVWTTPFKSRPQQGRPCSSSLRAYFCLHETLEDFYCYFNSISEFRYYSDCERQVQTFSSKDKPKDVVTKLLEFNDVKTSFDILSELKDIFGVDGLKTIKVWRDLNSVGKFEAIEIPSYCGIEWIKQNVCHPRYKANTKIHLIKTNRNTSKYIYNSEGSYQEDIENLVNVSLKVIV